MLARRGKEIFYKMYTPLKDLKHWMSFAAPSTIHMPLKKNPTEFTHWWKQRSFDFFLNWHNFFIVVNKKDYIIAFFNWHGILLCCNFKSNIIYSYYVKLKLRHGFYITILRLFWVLLLPIIIFSFLLLVYMYVNP